MFSYDEIASASSHSLGSFEGELKKVKLAWANWRSDELTGQLMHQYTTSPPADPLKQARSDLDNV
jgi:vesicle-associated membrane protein 7